MNKKSLLITFTVVLVGFAAGATYVLLTNSSNTPQARTDYVPNNYDELDKKTTPAAPKPDDVPPASEASKEATKEGKIICLKTKDQSGPQNLSCAIGLETDDGTAYALNANDPSTVGSLPNGQRIRVFGLVTVQESNYAISGTIKIKTIEKL